MWTYVEELLFPEPRNFGIRVNDVMMFLIILTLKLDVGYLTAGCLFLDVLEILLPV